MPDYISDEVSIDHVVKSQCGDVLDQWRKLKTQHFAPSWQQMDLSVLPSDVIPYIRVVDVLDNGEVFKYRFWGTGLSEIFGIERTGQLMHEPKGWPRGTGLGECAKVVALRQPVAFTRQARATTSERPFPTVVSCGIRLPLSVDGEQVTNVLSFCDFGVERATWLRLFANHPHSEKPPPRPRG